jgi:hypothetical protein
MGGAQEIETILSRSSGWASYLPRARCRVKRGDILLFTGTGTSPGDVAAVETVLKNNHLEYSTVSQHN